MLLIYTIYSSHFFLTFTERQAFHTIFGTFTIFAKCFLASTDFAHFLNTNCRISFNVPPRVKSTFFCRFPTPQLGILLLNIGHSLSPNPTCLQGSSFDVFCQSISSRGKSSKMRVRKVSKMIESLNVY